MRLKPRFSTSPKHVKVFELLDRWSHTSALTVPLWSFVYWLQLEKCQKFLFSHSYIFPKSEHVPTFGANQLGFFIYHFLANKYLLHVLVGGSKYPVE